MNCPTCKLNLVRGKYAGANVRECPECNGALLATSRAHKIERRIDKDIDQLMQEVTDSNATDTAELIRCPSCQSKMRKRLVKQLELFVDDCGQCGMSWFDGGELATLQLAFETDSQTVELNSMRDRLKNMTDEERQEYEANIAKLKDLGSPIGQAIRGATFDLTLRRYWRLWR